MRQLLIFSSMPPRPLNFWNCPTSLDPTNLLLIELQALPRSSLILLALACNLVTTGTRTVLAERIFERDWVNKHGTQHVDPHPSAAPTDSRGHCPQCSGHNEAPGLLDSIPLLSPTSPTNSAAFNASQQNLQHPSNTIQDGGSSQLQLVPSLPQACQHQVN